MKRRLRIVAVFLLAGAVVNVAVAWGCAIWIDLSGALSIEAYGDSYEGPDYKYWSAQRFRAPGACRVYSRWHDRDSNARYLSFVTQVGRPPGPVIPDWARLLLPSHEPSSGEFHAFFADTRGWPLHSMWSGLKVSKIRGSTTPMIETLGIALDPEMMADFNDHRHLRLLPLRPLPLGFAVNTIVYATLLWLLILGPFALRRFIRVRRGLCPKCAYPMGEAAECSECGKPLPGRMAVTT